MTSTTHVADYYQDSIPINCKASDLFHGYHVLGSQTFLVFPKRISKCNRVVHCNGMNNVKVNFIKEISNIKIWKRQTI